VSPRSFSRADRFGSYSVAALGCAIPVSVAADNLLLLVILICWACGGNYGDKWRTISDHPISRAAAALFIIIVAGMLWSIDKASASGIALKYLDLLFIPLFIYFFRDEKNRRLGLMLFCGTLILALLLSFLLKTGLVPQSDLFTGSAASPVVFKFRVTHNFFMAFAAFMFAWLAMGAGGNRLERCLWGILSIIAAINVLFMVEGATGYVVITALFALLALKKIDRRGLAILLSVLPAVFFLMLSTDNPLSRRVAQLEQELKTWQPGVGQRHSSSGLRLEFFGNTASIIAERPLLGVGTGGFAAAYAKQVAGTDMLPTVNPHNEYLMITAQTGLVGLVAMLALLIVSWRCATWLPTAMETGLARGLVIAMAIGCLFNSFLLDHAEGLFFAWMSGLLFAGYRRDPGPGKPA